jgi:hypothetical protein
MEKERLTFIRKTAFEKIEGKSDPDERRILGRRAVKATFDNNVGLGDHIIEVHFFLLLFEDRRFRLVA